MDLSAPLAWLVDEAAGASGPDRFLAELGALLSAAGLPLAGGTLTLATPHPIIARRTWMWRAETGAVIEALGFPGDNGSDPGSDAERGWLTELGPVHANRIGPAHDSPVLAWAGRRMFRAGETTLLREA